MSLERFDGGRVGRALFLYAGPADVMRGGSQYTAGRYVLYAGAGGVVCFGVQRDGMCGRRTVELMSGGDNGYRKKQ